jgi:hypothetical protein
MCNARAGGGVAAPVRPQVGVRPGLACRARGAGAGGLFTKVNGRAHPTFTNVSAGPPAVVRLRRFLKGLPRAAGLRAVKVEEMPAGEGRGEAPEKDNHADS